MFKSILVRCAGSEVDLPVHHVSLAVARMFGAHLTFLHVKLDVEATVAAMASTDMFGAGWIGDTMDGMQRDADALEQKASEAFQGFCAAEHLARTSLPEGSRASAEWSVQTGAEPAVIGEQGRYADLIVTGREDERGTVAFDVLEVALLETGRPLLIVPETTTTFATDVVAIAWKDTPEAARSVTAALPLIERAERVIVFSVAEDSPATSEGACTRLARSLRWHNANVESKVLPHAAGEPVQTLMDAVGEAGATLLVMGGYSHSRLREVVFGGFTRHVLQSASVPVLMTH